MQFERFHSLNDSVVGSFPHLHHLGFQRIFPNLWKCLWCNGMSVPPYAHPQLFKVFKHLILIYVWHRCGMQFERFYSLNNSVVGKFSHLHHLWFQPALPNLGKRLWCNGMNVLSYTHPQLFKVFKHLIYVWHGCGMMFERFYCLNNSVVGQFLHLHHIWFQPALPNLGKRLWW
jgi:uncharacterized Zn-finger protein